MAPPPNESSDLDLDPEGPGPDDIDPNDDDEREDVDHCPNCDKLIYVGSDFCPHCGEAVVVTKEKSNLPLWIFIVLALVGLAIAAGALFGR